MNRSTVHPVPRSWATIRTSPRPRFSWHSYSRPGASVCRGSLTTCHDLAAIALFSIFGVVVNQVCFVEGLSRTATPHSSINTCALAHVTRAEGAFCLPDLEVHQPEFVGHLG